MKNKKTTKRPDYNSLPARYYYLSAITLVSAILLYAYIQNQFQIIRFFLGISCTMFLPGYLLSLLIFPDESEMNNVERIGLGFGLSIPLTLTTVLFMDTLFGVPVTGMTIVASLSLLMAVIVVSIFAQNFLLKIK